MNDEEVKETQTTEEKPVENVDALAEFKNSDGEFDAAKIQKLVDDKKYYRSQIAKLKQTPEKVEEYGKDFVLDSKFDDFIAEPDNKKKIDDIFEKLDKLSLEKGMSVERNNDMRRFVLDELIDNKVIDLRSPAEKEAVANKILSERNEAVQKEIGEGTDLKAWNESVLSWMKGFCNSQAEYEMHKKLFETNSLWALSLNKVRQAQLGNRIPVVHSDAKFNEAEWNRAFLKADRETQDKMLQERAIELTKNK